MLFSQALDLFRQHVERCFESEAEILVPISKRRWLARWARTPLSEITTDAVHRYLSELVIKDLTKAEVREDARGLSTLFAWAVAEGHLDRQPLEDLPPLHRRAVRRPLEWTVEDQFRLLAELTPSDESDRFVSRNLLAKLLLNHVTRECHVPDLHPIVLLGLRTGLRLGYLVYLEWRHVFLEEQWIQIPSAETRWGEPLKVSLDLDCLESLRAIQDFARRTNCESPRVFDALDLPYQAPGIPDVNVIQVHLRAACLRAGVREGEFNSVRMSFAYNAVRRGLHWIETTRLVDWDDTQPLIDLYERVSPRRRVG